MSIDRFARSLFALAFALVSVFTGSALASDGVLEINQTCAVQTGCFAGDVPGFPVTLSQAGSYRLTSNLSLDDTVALGIDVRQGGVRIDFAGFVLEGEASANVDQVGVGSTLSTSRRVVVENGLIVDFNGECILVGDHARVERMRLHGCGTALEVGEESLVWGNIATETSAGMLLGDGSAHRDNQVSNGAVTAVITGGIASGVDVCNGVPCSVFPPRRRYYLTTTQSNGLDVPDLCAAGFHLATPAEIAAPSSLEYATDLGRTRPDSGDGPPADAGWVRSGGVASVSGDPGTTNCDLWTSTTFGHSGTIATTAPAVASRVQVGAWSLGQASCFAGFPAWCVED